MSETKSVRIGTDSSVYDVARVRYSNYRYSATMRRDDHVGRVRFSPNDGATASENAVSAAWAARDRMADSFRAAAVRDVPDMRDVWEETHRNWQDRSCYVTVVMDEGPGLGYLVAFLPVEDVARAGRMIEELDR